MGAKGFQWHLVRLCSANFESPGPGGAVLKESDRRKHQVCMVEPKALESGALCTNLTLSLSDIP